MPPVEHFVPRFAAEPPQQELPSGARAKQLAESFLLSVGTMGTEGSDLGDVGGIVWYPERTWYGRTYVPATASTANGYEIYGYLRFLSGDGTGALTELAAAVDFTDETAARNPLWTLDLCDEVIGSWRGEGGDSASMTLVWGRALVAGGATVTAELGEVTVDQCALVQDRFTLIAPDDYRGDLLEVHLYSSGGGELARESLYDAGDEDDADD
jgi:hypothetical protein